MRRPAAWALQLVATAALAVGCSQGVQEDAGVEAASGIGSLALVHMERQAEAGSAQPRVTSSVKVARYRGIEGERLLRLLGAEARDLDTCHVVGGLDEAPLPATAQVELMSVGTIGLRVGEEAHELSPRLFPALATTAGGFFYADAFDTQAGPDTTAYAIAAGGKGGIGRFALALTLPDAVGAVQLSGEPVVDVANLARGADVALQWDAAQGGDHLELELFVGGTMLACSLRDDGHFLLPREQLSALDADDNAAMVLRRVRIQPVDMQGIENAYVRLSSARTFTARVR
jgi:hypothetical protein